jgi:hypothetical protein
METLFALVAVTFYNLTVAAETVVHLTEARAYFVAQLAYKVAFATVPAQVSAGVFGATFDEQCGWVIGNNYKPSQEDVANALKAGLQENEIEYFRSEVSDWADRIIKGCA